MLLAPGAIIVFEKPLQGYFDRLDKETRERELRKLVWYMRRQNLIADNYEHGLQITDKARKQLLKADLDNQLYPPQISGIVNGGSCFTTYRKSTTGARQILSNKLPLLGMHQLQRSVCVHPFACEETIQAIAAAHDIGKYMTYIEAAHINNQASLIQKLSKPKI